MSSNDPPQSLSDFNLGLPRQTFSSTAWAAWMCRHYLEAIPVPPEFKYVSRKRSSVAEPGEGERPQMTHKVPSCKATGLVWDAFYEIRTVAVLFDESELLHLQEAERAELLAAVGRSGCHADSALPRKWALTILIKNTSLVKEQSVRILDAAAHIASFRSEDPDQPHTPAARDVRLSVLTNRNACVYAGTHEVSLRESELVSMILVRVNEDGELVAHKTVPESTWASYKIAYCSITRAAAELFEMAGIAEETPPSLFRVNNIKSDDVTGAYAHSVQSTNDEFWAQLEKMEAPHSIEYKLCARFVEVYLKIGHANVVNHAEGSGIANENVFFGTLLHKKGQERATEQFLVDVLTHEYNTQRMQFPNKPSSDILVGLQYPDRDVNDRNLGLHIFEVQWEWHSLRRQLSSFGRLAVPGSGVCDMEGASVPRLVYKLKPFNIQNYNKFYVMPCSAEQTIPLDQKFAKSMWTAFNTGIRMCWNRFCDNECVSSPRPRPLKAQKPSNEPTDEDKHLASMGSVPMYGAFRIGDVLRHVSRCPVPTYKEFLTSGLRRLGPGKSMVDLYKSCGELQDKIVKLDADNCALKQALSNAQADAAQMVQPQPIQASRPEAILRTIGGLNVKRSGHLLFKGADTEALTFLTLISLSHSGKKNDVPFNEETMNEVLKCVDGLPSDVLVHLSTVVKHVQPGYFIVVIMTQGDGSGTFMLFEPEHDRWEQVTLERALESHGKPGTLLFQYFEAQKKLHPLAPQSRGQ